MLRQGTMVLSRLLILPFLLAILIGLDVYKTYEVPDRTISLNGGDVKGLNRSGLPKSPIFFLPCGISLLFNIAVVFASFQEWSWAYSHKDRRRLHAFVEEDGVDRLAVGGLEAVELPLDFGDRQACLLQPHTQFRLRTAKPQMVLQTWEPFNSRKQGREEEGRGPEGRGQWHMAAPRQPSRR